MDHGILPGMGLLERRRLVMWLVLSVLSVLSVLLAWFGFRGYLTPDLLFHFSNSLYY